jgi:hypothetical protein
MCADDSLNLFRGYSHIIVVGRALKIWVMGGILHVGILTILLL